MFGHEGQPAPLVASRATTRTAPPPRLRPPRQSVGIAAFAEQTLAAEIIPGKPSAIPEPPVIRGQIGRRLADRFEVMSRTIASTIACRISPRPRNSSKAARIAAGPCATRCVLRRARPRPVVWRCRTRTSGVVHRRQRMVAHARFRQQHVADEKIAFVIVRPFSGKAGQNKVKSDPKASSNDLATGPILPCRSNRMSNSI